MLLYTKDLEDMDKFSKYNKLLSISKCYLSIHHKNNRGIDIVTKPISEGHHQGAPNKVHD